MPFPPFFSDTEILTRIRRAVAARKNLPDPDAIQANAPLRAAPLNYTEPGLRLLADDLNQAFAHDTEPLVLEADQVTAAEIVSIEQVWTLVQRGLIVARLRLVLAEIKGLPAGTPIGAQDKLREAPLTLSDAELQALAAQVNAAFQGSGLDLPEAKVQSPDVTTVQSLAQIIQRHLP